ncbi:MAG: (4Fe-4S)-binding protein [Aurantibacter sp.]
MKEYKKEDLTVVWDVKKCIHSAICANGLPSVFKPKERPWIQTDDATTQEIMDQVDKCPSGALSYYVGEKKEEKMENGATKVEVAANGPLLVSGNLVVTSSDGKEEHKKRTTAFCRCGASENKPYCDGTHNEIGFEG